MKQSNLKRLLGALQSGSQAARLGILIRAFGPITRTLDSVLPQGSSVKLTDNDAPPPCVMIVSPPRSGSTIMYQVLVRAIPCVYITNLHMLFPRRASGYLLKRDRFGKGLSGFKNYYGYTPFMNDVNEANELVSALFVGDPDQSELRARFIRFAHMLGAREGLPLIFKNVRNYPNIHRLHCAVPELKFLRVRRDPYQVVQSVLRAYHDLAHFHPIPKALQGRDWNDPVDFAVRQILEIEREIDEQMERIDSGVRLDWTYEDFCVNTWENASLLVEKYLGLNPTCLRKDSLAEPLRASMNLKVPQEEADRIRVLLDTEPSR
jgi:Sulfotransferase family